MQAIKICVWIYFSDILINGADMITKKSVFIFILFLKSMLSAQEFFMPTGFQNGELIEQIILISDVDGVIRDSTDTLADPRIIEAIKALLNNKNVDVTFISGTPIDNNPALENWRSGNVPLNKVFGKSFAQELLENQVTIYGVLGGHKMNEDGSLKVVDEYSLQNTWELGKLLIHAFLKEVLEYGLDEQKVLAQKLQIELDLLTPAQSPNSANVTASEFYQIIEPIRQFIDPNFRLISNGALIETQTSSPPWNTVLSSNWLKNELNQPQYQISHLPLSKKQIATGFVNKSTGGFNYLLIGKTNKGITTAKHIQEKIKHLPRALIITIGDTQVDFPMHKNAHLAFHVGLEQVWLNNPLPNCIMVRNSAGKDRQHLEGTLKVLSIIADGLGKSFYDLRYIPRVNSAGCWDYYSPKELQAQKKSNAKCGKK